MINMDLMRSILGLAPAPAGTRTGRLGKHWGSKAPFPRRKERRARKKAARQCRGRGGPGMTGLGPVGVQLDTWCPKSRGPGRDPAPALMAWFKTRQWNKAMWKECGWGGPKPTDPRG